MAIPLDSDCHGGGKVTLIFKVNCDASMCQDDMAHKIITRYGSQNNYNLRSKEKKVEEPMQIPEIGKIVAETPTVESARTLYFYQEESGIVDMDLCEIITCEEDSMPDYEQGKVFICATDQEDKIKV